MAMSASTGPRRGVFVHVRQRDPIRVQPRLLIGNGTGAMPCDQSPASAPRSIEGIISPSPVCLL